MWCSLACLQTFSLLEGKCVVFELTRVKKNGTCNLIFVRSGIGLLSPDFARVNNGFDASTCKRSVRNIQGVTDFHFVLCNYPTQLEGFD